MCATSRCDSFPGDNADDVPVPRTIGRGRRHEFPSPASQGKSRLIPIQVRTRCLPYFEPQSCDDSLSETWHWSQQTCLAPDFRMKLRRSGSVGSYRSTGKGQRVSKTCFDFGTRAQISVRLSQDHTVRLQHRNRWNVTKSGFQVSFL